MTNSFTTPQEYINSLSEERRVAISKLHQLILDNLPQGFELGMTYGMIGYYVPHSVYPSGYHVDPSQPLPFINLASQKNFIALHHMGIYADKKLLEWFTQEYPKHSTTKPDMGKSCIRFKKVEKIPYELIAQLVSKMSVEEWITPYEEQLKK